MPDIKEKLKSYFNTLLSHPGCVSNTILVALTTGFEQAWENILLKCPEKPSNHPWYSSNICYSVVFLVAPALALWMLGIFGSNMAWRLCQGLKFRKESHECNLFNVFVIILRTSVIPAVWIFIALMDGDFFACYNYLPSCPEDRSSGLVDSVNCTSDTTAWHYQKKFESQMIGWVYLILYLTVGSCVVFCSRKYSPRTYFPNLYSNKLKKEERMLMENLLMEQAGKEGKRNVGALLMEFSKNSLPASHWESICREYTEEERNKNGSKELVYYSPLSEFLKDKKNEDILKNYDVAIAQSNKQTPPNTNEPNNQTTPNTNEPNNQTTPNEN